MKKLINGLSLRQSAELKSVNQSDDDSVLYIAGYASVYRADNGFLQIDRDNEVVNTDNLDISSYEKNPVLIHAHQWDRVVGRITKIVKDYKGLYVEGEVHKLTGEEAVYEAVKKGLIKSFSIGFLPREIDIVYDDYLHTTSAELVEISLQPVQSNPDALFSVTSKKGLGISIADYAKQNNLTTTELKGIFSESIKGKSLNKDNITEPQPVVEPKVETPATPEPQPVVEPKVETPIDTTLSLTSLSTTIIEALNKVEEVKEQKRLVDEKAEADAKEQVKLAEEQRVKNALAYVKEQAELIAQTNVESLDFDAYEEFYEVVSQANEAIHSKIESLQALVNKQD